MPGYRQPSSLESLSLTRVCQLLDGTCRRLQAWSLETSVASVIDYSRLTVRPYFDDALTARLRSQVIEETTRQLFGPSADGSNVIAGPAPLYLLVLLLGPDIKRLRVNMCCYYGCSHQTSILKLLAGQGVGLESLELARSSLLGLEVKLLGPALLSMRNLRRLALRNIASDAVLQVVGTSCPRLAVLDIACSRQVTDVGLKQLLLHVEFRDRGAHHSSSHESSSSTSTSSTSPRRWSRFRSLLAKLRLRAPKPGKRDKEQVLLYHCESKNPLCDTLRVLNVANTGVTSAGVLLALMHMPQLESLAEYSHMGRVVEIMKRGVIDFKRPFGLTEARSSRTTPGRLELLAQACPRVRRLHISEPHHPPEALRLFPHVSALSVHSVPVKKEWLDGFYGYLAACGAGLRELDVRLAQSEPAAPLDLDLREILACCPELRTFTTDGANCVWSLGPEPAPLRHLRAVQVGRSIAAPAVAKLLAVAPELRNLHLHSCPDMSSADLERLTSESRETRKPPRPGQWASPGPVARRTAESSCSARANLVQNLECFYIYQMSGISAATVSSLFKSCHRLRTIGHLANWGLDAEGIAALRAVLAKTNLDVDLCSGSHWFHNDCMR